MTQTKEVSQKSFVNVIHYGGDDVPWKPRTPVHKTGLTKSTIKTPGTSRFFFGASNFSLSLARRSRAYRKLFAS